MSWGWLAPLLVAALGAASVTVVARRCQREARRTTVATEGLRTALVDLAQARRDLVLDLSRYAPDCELVAGAAEKGPVPQ